MEAQLLQESCALTMSDSAFSNKIAQLARREACMRVLKNVLGDRILVCQKHFVYCLGLYVGCQRNIVPFWEVWEG